MVTTPVKEFLTFAEYLTYEDSTDNRYELERGVLVAMGQARGQHGAIMKFLERSFDAEIARLGLDWVAMQAAIAVRIPQVGTRDTARIPDICVIPKIQWEGLLNQEAVIELDQPPPLLVVEIVSKGTEVTDRRKKRAEYNILGIPVYIMVDFLDRDRQDRPVEPKVTVLNLVEGFYDEAVFQGQQLVEIPTFPELKLTVDRIIKAG